MASGTHSPALRNKLDEAWSRFFPQALWFMSREAAVDPVNARAVIDALRSGSLDAFRFACELEKLVEREPDCGETHAD